MGSGEIKFVIEESTLGLVLVAGSATGVCAVLLGDDRAELRRELGARFPQAQLVAGDAGFRAVAARAVTAVESPDSGPDVPLDLQGTPFQRDVWLALTAIPSGSTASYGELARRIGRPRSVRAVGQACGANPIAVIVPCHRAVGSDGSLTGYRWGIERKRLLLERESAARPRAAQAAGSSQVTFSWPATA